MILENLNIPKTNTLFNEGRKEKNRHKANQKRQNWVGWKMSYYTELWNEKESTCAMLHYERVWKGRSGGRYKW